MTTEVCIEEAVGKLDRLLGTLAGRSLVAADDLVNDLLDIRNALTRADDEEQ